jgi:hypothetical protein
MGWSAVLILFYGEKFKVMHFGHNNAQVDYCIDSTCLLPSTIERDLGVLILGGRQANLPFLPSRLYLSLSSSFWEIATAG